VKDIKQLNQLGGNDRHSKSHKNYVIVG